MSESDRLPYDVVDRGLVGDLRADRDRLAARVAELEAARDAIRHATGLMIRAGVLHLFARPDDLRAYWDEVGGDFGQVVWLHGVEWHAGLDAGEPKEEDPL
jgi:hypothetical protein